MITGRSDMSGFRYVLRVWGVVGLLTTGCASTRGRNEMSAFQALAHGNPKPFVVVETTGTETVIRGQGVFVSSLGHVLSAGHVSWNNDDQCYADTFRVNLRTSDQNVPEGYVHTHKTTFVDREGAVFHEYRYAAKLIKQEASRFIDGKDLCLIKVDAKAAFPTVDFFSDEEPTLGTGDVLYLCHYHWPHKAAEPTFLINPIEIVGVVETSSGLQYLAKGFCRWGSSGGAILKDGRLVGIQSAAYTINAKDVGEVPSGLLSFHSVYRSMFDRLVNTEAR